MKTIFQKIADREIPSKMVYEDDLCFAIEDINPQAPVHILVIPKRVIVRLGESVPADEALLGHLLVVAGTVAKERGIAGTGFRTVINSGKDAGETVPHLHVHVVGGRPLGWPPG